LLIDEIKLHLHDVIRLKENGKEEPQLKMASGSCNDSVRETSSLVKVLFCPRREETPTGAPDTKVAIWKVMGAVTLSQFFGRGGPGSYAP